MPDHTPESLRAMVAAATPGPWCYTGFPTHPHNDALLAAAAPEVCLALADALETIDAERQAREAAEARVRELEAS